MRAIPPSPSLTPRRLTPPILVLVSTALLSFACADAPDVDDAREFVERVEAFQRDFGEYSARVAWVNATYITHDTNWLQARTDAEDTRQRVRFASEAKRFNDVDLPNGLRRKIDLIKLGVNLPAPDRPGAAASLAELTTRMTTTYATGKIELDGELVARDELEERMGTVRDPDVLREMWVKWREVPIAENEDGTTMKQDYAAMVELGNEGARELGYEDVGAMWRARYDLAPEAFVAETERLWTQVEPLYDALHCHVRAELNDYYGDDVVPLGEPLRADLLGNMWAQAWGNIYPLVAPPESDPGFDLTTRLRAEGFDAVRMVETGEAFFSSLGFDPLPETFWERSQITRPADREVVCHASAWDLDAEDDVRIKMCARVNADDFRTVHHELGHNYYQRAYKDLSPIFRTGANSGFHEAIGDMIALSVTPEYLRRIGLLDEVPDPSKDVGLLLDRALRDVAFLPFGLLMDKWRWQVFSGEVKPEEYNDAWWALREQYQGVRPPVTRTPEQFDPGAKHHIANNVEYTRYFVGLILQFQFHRAACEIAGWEGPLHRCSIYGSEGAGERLKAMLELGRSRPWPEALEAFTGTPELDASAVVEYFAPLMDWLAEQNAERECGW